MGCRRGTFGEVMQPVTLCPKSYTVILRPTVEASRKVIHHCQCEHIWCLDESGSKCPRCNNHSLEVIEADLRAINREMYLPAVKRKREEDISPTDENTLSCGESVLLGPVFRNVQNNTATKDLGLSQHRLNSLYHPLISLGPLDQCILAILWELAETPSSLSTVPLFNWGSEGKLENLVLLLRSAALYQAKLENVTKPKTLYNHKAIMADQNRIPIN